MVLALAGRLTAGWIARRGHRVLVAKHVDQVGTCSAVEVVAFEIALVLTVHRHADVDGAGRCSSGVAGRVLGDQLTRRERQQRGGHRHGQDPGTWKYERGRHVSSPIATPVARGLRLFSRGSRETAPCYRYWVGGPDEPIIGGGPEGPEAGRGPPAAGPWGKLTTGTARSPSSAWKKANGLKPSAPAISEVGRDCSEML